MNRKPPELPDIEDATLLACLAPLMEAMHGGGAMSSPSPSADPVARPMRIPVGSPGGSPTGSPAGSPSGSNDNPMPTQEPPRAIDHDHPRTPKTLAEWRALTDDEFGAFRMIDLFLTMTDAELVGVTTDFPKQIGGTVARIARIKRRLAARYDAVTIVMALLERAIARAAADREDA